MLGIKPWSQSCLSLPGRVTEGQEQPGIEQTSSGLQKQSEHWEEELQEELFGEPGVAVPALVINVTPPGIGQSILGGLRGTTGSERARSSVGISVPDFPCEYFMNQLDESLVGCFFFFFNLVFYSVSV